MVNSWSVSGAFYGSKAEIKVWKKILKSTVSNVADDVKFIDEFIESHQWITIELSSQGNLYIILSIICLSAMACSNNNESSTTNQLGEEDSEKVVESTNHTTTKEPAQKETKGEATEGQMSEKETMEIQNEKAATFLTTRKRRRRSPTAPTGERARRRLATSPRRTRTSPTPPTQPTRGSREARRDAFVFDFEHDARATKDARVCVL